MRNRLVPLGDRIARFLPARWRLSFRGWARRWFGGVESELTELAQVAGRGRTAVDAGANEGFYALELSRLFRRVLAVEPNAALTADLRAARRSNVEILPRGLSDRAARSELHVPIRGGVRLSGWGTLEAVELPAHDAEEVLAVELVTLDSLELKDLDFLKVDVEGHELQVLDGAKATLLRCRPRLLIEIRPRNLEAVAAKLRGWGFVRAAAGTPSGPVSPGNFLFEPDRGATAR